MRPGPTPPDLGDLVVVLLAGTLAGLRERLVVDGFPHAADLVADLVEVADDYLIGEPSREPDAETTRKPPGHGPPAGKKPRKPGRGHLRGI